MINLKINGFYYRKRVSQEIFLDNSGQTKTHIFMIKLTSNTAAGLHTSLIFKDTCLNTNFILCSLITYVITQDEY